MSLRFRSTTLVYAGVALGFALTGCRTAPTTRPTTAPTPTRPVEARPAWLTPISSLSAHRLVPMPLSVNPGTGAPFTVATTTTIVVPTGNAEVARTGEMLARILRMPTALPIQVTTSDAMGPRGAIALRLGGPASLGDEGYGTDFAVHLL